MASSPLPLSIYTSIHSIHPAIYGPFDKYIPVMKKDGQYVLLAEDEYNRLKVSEYIQKTEGPFLSSSSPACVPFSSLFCLSAYSSVRPSACSVISLSIHPSIHPSIDLSIYPSFTG